LNGFEEMLYLGFRIFIWSIFELLTGYNANILGTGQPGNTYFPVFFLLDENIPN
jgi:hypothetical protein